jgi:hypothetical protein
VVENYTINGPYIALFVSILLAKLIDTKYTYMFIVINQFSFYFLSGKEKRRNIFFN